MYTRRHTTLNLDVKLLEEAQSVLGTKQTTETIHRALREIVDRDKRQRLLEMGTGDLTPQRLSEVRKNRCSDSPDKSLPA